MPFDTREFVAEVAARSALKRLRGPKSFGVFIENLPPLDPQHFVDVLAERREGKPLRVAVLGTSARVRGARNLTVTTSPTETNVWRNDATTRGGVPTAVLVVGPAPKVSSLRSTLPLVTQADLRSEIADRAIALLESPERTAFWRALEEMPGEVPLQQLAQFAAEATSAAARSRATLMDLEWKLVYNLGLVPQKTLLAASGPRGAVKAIRQNRVFVNRLRTLSSRDRSHLLRVLEDDQSGDAKKTAASAILRFEKRGSIDDLKGLDTELVRTLLRGDSDAAPPKAGGDQPQMSKRERLDGDALALDLLLSESRGVKVAAKRYADAIDPTGEDSSGPEAITVDRREILPRPKVGTSQATALFGRLISEEIWGGVAEALEASDHVAALKLVASGHGDITEFRPGAEQNVRWMLARAVNQGLADAAVLEAWDGFATHRAAMLPAAGPLIDHPLLALAGSDELRKGAAALLDSYGLLLDGVKKTAERLRAAGSIEPAKRLFAYTLCLDVAFIRSSAGWTAIAAPTHPFHLWRWLALLDIIGSDRKDLAKLGMEVLEPLVTDPPASAPDIVLSPFAVGGRLARAIPFVPVGSFGALPQFAEVSTRQSAKFRARSLSKIAERFVRLMPYSSLGLRVLVVDPPGVAGAVEDLLSLRSTFDDDLIVPLHIVVARTRPQREGTDEEDLDLEIVARDAREGDGSVIVMPQFRQLSDVVGELKSIQPHITVVFDPGEGQELRIGITNPPALSPLVMPRAYRYDAFDDRLDVVVAGDGGMFGSYHDLFCELLDLPRSDFVGRRSGASRFARDLEGIAHGSMWMVVVDQGVEPTLRVGGAVCLDARNEGGRDLLTYTAHQETVEELVADAVRAAGLIPTEETVKRTLRQLLQLSGEALLALAKPRPDVSIADRRISKGVMGVLAAARWYGAAHADAVLVSLDDPTSRRWILGSNDDNRQGDLLGVRLSPDGVVVECVEVKAHEDLENVVRVNGGKIEGRAVVQVDQTLRVLQRILTPATKATIDRARSDILKDQLYRAVASRNYPSDQRARFVQMLEELFANGPQQLSGLIVRVRIASGETAPGNERPVLAVSPAGNSVGVLDLVESELALRETLAGPPTARKVAEAARKIPTQKAVPPTVTRPLSAGSNPTAQVLEPTGTTNSDSGLAKIHEPEKRPDAARTVCFLVGHTATGEQIYWDPHRSDEPLNNFGLLVTGDPGSGKTQILRAVIEAVTQAHIPVCIFDFKNDYSEPAFAKSLGLKVFDVERDGLPFNPLSLVGDQNGELRPISQINEIASILRRIFHLGDQQEAHLKRAIQVAFTSAGITVSGRQRVAELPPSPSFDDVAGILHAGGKQTIALLNRLSPLFDLNLFPTSSAARTSFEQLIAKSAVLDLHKLPNDRIKAAMAEFLIVRLHEHVLRGDQPRELRRLLVFDEAWRVKDSEQLQELAREGRAFGVGIAIGTQFPGDIPESLAGNLASQLLLHNSEIEHRKSVARTLVGSASGPIATQVITQTQALKKHEGFFRNQQYSPYVLVTTVPHYARRSGS